MLKIYQLVYLINCNLLEKYLTRSLDERLITPKN